MCEKEYREESEERWIWKNRYKENGRIDKCLNSLFIHQYPFVISTHLAALCLYVLSYDKLAKTFSLSMCVYGQRTEMEGLMDERMDRLTICLALPVGVTLELLQEALRFPCRF